MTIITKIVKGKGRGKSILGYATANALTQDQKMFGNEGAWYVSVRLSNPKHLNTPHPAVCGVCKKADDWVLETHILDFNEDLYDQNVAIDFIYKIRDLITFKSLDESKAQLESDIDFVRRYKSCTNCQFCVYQDHGYSNYTVEGTAISCLVNKFDEVEESYDGNYWLGLATNCEYYNFGDSWHLDVDGESERPSDEWLLSELRDAKIRNVIDDKVG